MPHNLIKVYDSLLELGHLSVTMRNESLRRVFNRDFDGTLNFRKKQIRPIKKDGEVSIETAFRHLTTRKDKDENGRVLQSRSFEASRSLSCIGLNTISVKVLPDLSKCSALRTVWQVEIE